MHLVLKVEQLWQRLFEVAGVRLGEKGRLGKARSQMAHE